MVFKGHSHPLSLEVCTGDSVTFKIIATYFCFKRNVLGDITCNLENLEVKTDLFTSDIVLESSNSYTDILHLLKYIYTHFPLKGCLEFITVLTSAKRNTCKC